MGPGLVLAYHGCDRTLRDDLVSGKVQRLRHSKNPYDWLGSGAYFFESDPTRAQSFAEASASNPTAKFTAIPITTPAVIGSILEVRHVLDLDTIQGRAEFDAAYVEYALTKKTLPVNKQAHDSDDDMILRALDRTIIDLLHTLRNNERLPPYDLVRCSFPQGKPVAGNSAFRESSHVQLALRNPDCVRGFFLVPGDQLMTPAERTKANAALDKLRTRSVVK